MLSLGKKMRLLSMAALAAIASPAWSQISIGTETGSTLSTGTGTSSLQSPFNSYYGYSWVQTLYLRNEINAASGNITSISYYYAGSSLSNSNQLKIYMANVSRSSFTGTTDWEPTTNMTVVFDGVISGTLPGWVNITLSTPFPYQNNANLLIAVDENTPNDNGSTGFRASNLGPSRVIFYRSDTNDPDPTAPPTASGVSNYVGNIQINGLTALTCQPPTAITMGTLGATTAAFSFTAPASSSPTGYEWEVRTTGYPGSGSPASSGTVSATSGTATGLTPGTAYTLYVRSNCGGTYSAWVASSSFTTAPANDEASGAITLTPNGDLACAATVNGTTISTTPSADAAPSCSASGINDDVWYKFTATSTAHQFKFTNVTTGTMAVALYTGTPGSLTATTYCGSGATVNFSDLAIGTQYYARLYTTSSSSTTTTPFTVCLGTIPSMTYVSSTTTQVSTAVNAGTLNQQVIRIDVVVNGIPNGLNLTQLNLNTTGTTNVADILNAKVYYTGTSTTFAATNQFGAAVASPNGAFTVTGSQALTGSDVNTTNYFWLAYDIDCGATGTNLLDAQCTGITVGGTAQTPTVTAPSGSRAITAASFSATTLQPSTSIVQTGFTNQQVLRVALTGCQTSTVSGITFTIGGTTSAADITNAKVYYTTNTTFATTTQYGTTVANPNGTFTVNGSQALGGTTGYFWLTYDIPVTATGGNVVDASCVSAVVGGNTVTPTTPNPTGTRTIVVTPVNDECVNATAFPTIPGDGTCASVTAKTQYATQSMAACAGDAHDDIWYSFVCPAGVTSLIFNNTTISGASDRVTQFFSGTCGSLTSILCSDPESGTITGLTPGATYYMRIHCYYSTDNTEVSVCLKTAQMAFVSATTEQPTTSSVPQGSADQNIIRVNVVAVGNDNPLAVTQFTFNTTGSTNVADVTNAKVYYTGTSTTFSNATLFGSAVAAPNGTFVVNGSQALTGGSTNTNNYFFLAYDVACNATVANVLDAQCTALDVAGPRTPTATNPTGTRAITAVTYTAATTQPSTGAVPIGGANQPVVRVDVTGCSSSVVSSLTFSTTGTTNVADISAAKVFYTTSTTFAPTTQFGTTVATPNGTFTVTGSQALGAGTGYFWLVYDIASSATAANVVDASCTSATVAGNTAAPSTPNPTGTRSIVLAPANDEAPGAVSLTVGAGCTTNPYDNTNAFQSFAEPFPSCKGSAGYAGLWFKFVAPASGSVKVSCDGTGSLGDSRIALYSASNVNDYSTFSIVACDDDNGVASSTRSLFYASGLTAGTTYYVVVDLYSSSSTRGTFCVTVDELSASMLATTAGDCVSDQASVGSYNTNYRGWISLVDAAGNLNANVRQQTGTAASFASTRTIKSGTARTDANGLSYLNRNFLITGTDATSADVQLFFTDAEVTNLGASLASLNVSRVPGSSCNASFGGVATVLPQTASGSANGVSFLQFTTPGFSNFYIMSGTTPLPLDLVSFKGQNKGNINELTWETANERELDYFELQRSADGSNFVTLDKIDAKNRISGSSYVSYDNAPLEGLNLYRLNITDRYGKPTLSHVVELKSHAGAAVSINAHPNPVTSVMHITIAGKPDGKALIVILDMFGKTLQTITPNSSDVSVDMSRMSAGTYFVKFIDNSHTIVSKIVKN